MSTVEQYIYQVTTASEFRYGLQNGVVAARLSQEETDALVSLRNLLSLTTEELQQALSEKGPLIGWF